VLDRNVPLMWPPEGGQIGADRDESEGVRASGRAGESKERPVAGGGCGAIAAGELSAGGKVVETRPRGSGSGAEARQCRKSIESRTWRKTSGQSAGADQAKVRWSSGRTIWADAGGGTFGIGRRREGEC